MKYRPPNGTEGDMFMDKFCFQCQHDDIEANKLCEIIARTMVFDVDEEEYPDEWQYDKDGNPVCINFKGEE